MTPEEMERRIRQLEAIVRQLKTGKTFNLPSGADQAAAGAAAGELYHYTANNTIRIGV
jgi:hypothetical protein